MLAASLAAAALPAPTRASAPTVTARLLTPTFVFPSETVLRYELMIQAAELERFNVRVVPPQYTPAPEAEYLGGPHAEGSPLGQVREWQITGGQPGPLVGIVEAVPTCSPRSSLLHGYEPAGRDQDLTLLAGQPATVTVGYQAGHHAVWPSLRLAPTFVLTNQMQDGQGTLERDLSIEAPEPARSGASGVRIVLWTSPQSGLPGRAGRLSLQPGQPIAIHLRTEPPLPGERIALHVADPGTTTWRPLRSVRLDRHGQASIAQWRPPGSGEHELWATYTSSRPDLTDDFACARAIDIAGQRPVVIRRGSAPPVRVVSVDTTRGRRGYRVSVRLLCGHAELPMRCQRQLALTAGRRILQTRRIAVRSSRTTTVRLRIRSSILPRTLRATLRPIRR